VAVAGQPGTAEVAVTVADRFQGRGVGRLLLAALDRAAERAGVEVLVYLVDPTNRRMLRLLRGLGIALRFHDELVEGRQRPGAPGPGRHLTAGTQAVRGRSCRAA
jgi:ribosomal protein S18 acetylase RimI-like enzyme